MKRFEELNQDDFQVGTRFKFLIGSGCFVLEVVNLTRSYGGFLEVHCGIVSEKFPLTPQMTLTLR